MIQSDSQILAAIAKGDDSVLEHLYRQVLPKVKSYVQRNSGTVDDARDVFQDAVIIFYKHVKLGKFNTEHDIAGFIFSVSRNLWINAAKKKNRVIALGADDTSETGPSGNLADELMTREREAYIVKVFSALGDSCKQILLYSIYDKFSMKEIKEKMGFTSENVAKTKNYKCKQRLMELIKKNTSIQDYLKA